MGQTKVSIETASASSTGIFERDPVLEDWLEFAILTLANLKIAKFNSMIRVFTLMEGAMGLCNRFSTDKWQYWRCWWGLTIMIVSCFPHQLRGATILGVNKDKNKVVVYLDPVEMARLTLKADVLTEIQAGDETYFIYVTPFNLNPLKRTVVLLLNIDDENEEDLELAERLKPKQRVDFRTHHQGMLGGQSTHIGSQASRFQYPLVLGGAGLVVDQLKRTSSSSEESYLAVGYKTEVKGSMMLVPRDIHVFLGFGGKDIRTKKSVTDVVNPNASYDAKERYELTNIEPGVSWIINDRYSLGIEYEWSGIRVTEGSYQQTLIYNYTFSQPIGSLTIKEEKSETTLRVRGGDKGVGSLANRSFLAVASSQKKVNIPASVEVDYRRFASSRWNWTLSVGYMFNQFKDEAGARTPSVPESSLFSAFGERFLDHGDKLDLYFSYRGGRSWGLSRIRQETNTLSLGFAWENPTADHWFWSWGGTLEGGQLLPNNDNVEQSQEQNQLSTGGGSSKAVSVGAVAFFRLQKEFIPGHRRRATRRS